MTGDSGLIQSIPILSLVVAALAVFVGPVISWYAAKRQLTSSLAVANKQIVAPMRQAWINNLRDVLSELLSSALHYYVSGYEDRTDAEYQRIELLNYKMKLMLNPKEDDHRRLEQLVDQMIGALSSGDSEFEPSHKAALALSRKVFKREWDRVKDTIPQA